MSSKQYQQRQEKRNLELMEKEVNDLVEAGAINKVLGPGYHEYVTTHLNPVLFSKILDAWLSIQEKDEYLATEVNPNGKRRER